MLKNIDQGRECITTPEAAKRSGLSKVYLAHLLKKGTLEGFQVGRDWCVYTDSLQKFLETPRKSGPKGPRKKKTEQGNSDSTSKKNESDTL
jgi:excisionase family DNA binding protein